ncbi:MAG: cation transporter [Firmicutes bacterium]|nr:cation transporter [Bacillota bacterium]
MEQASDIRNVTMRVSTINIMVNFVLSVIKLTAGILANSGALISDAAHSASDVFSTFIVIIGVNYSSKKSDKEHQYGHERLECVAAIVLAVILFATGVGIGWSGLEKILNRSVLIVPGTLALAAALVSIVIKEWMYWFTRAAAKKVNSGALMADAWHHRSDALSSLGALVGIAGARLGFPVLDSVASVVISVFVAKAALEIFKDAIDKMVDKSCSDETVAKMKDLVSSQEGVLHIDNLKTRLFGARIYVDIDIAADSNLSLEKSHEIAQRVHDAIETEFTEVKHCMVHVNPKK